MTDAAPDGGNDGKHVVGLADALGDAGVHVIAWNAAGTVARVLTHGASHATRPDETEFPGAVLAGPAGDKAFKGIATAATVRIPISDPAPAASAYLKRIVYKTPNGSPNRTLKRVMVVCGTRPVGANLVVEVRKRAAADQGTGIDRYTDTNNTVQTTVTVADAGDPFTAENSGLSIVLASDDELTIKYGATGDAEDVTILLQIE